MGADNGVGGMEVDKAVPTCLPVFKPSGERRAFPLGRGWCYVWLLSHFYLFYIGQRWAHTTCSYGAMRCCACTPTYAHRPSNLPRARSDGASPGGRFATVRCSAACSGEYPGVAKCPLTGTKLLMSGREVWYGTGVFMVTFNL